MQQESEQLTLLQGDSLARTYQLPALYWGLGENAHRYLWKLLDCIASYDQNTSSLKMSQTCFQEITDDGSSGFLASWPRSGLMRSGTVYRLPQLTPNTIEIGCGLWPTPLASDCKDFRKDIAKLYPYLQKHQVRIIHFLMTHNFSDLEIIREYEKAMGYPIGHTDLNHSETP